MAELPVEIGQVADQLRLALLGRLFREPGIDQGVRLVVVEPIVRAPVELSLIHIFSFYKLVRKSEVGHIRTSCGAIYRKES